MLQMMTIFLLGWEMWMWKKFKLVHKKPLHGLKSPRKGGKSGKKFNCKKMWD